MGGVGITIYGIKDQWSSFIVHLVAVPNNRLADTIGHVYLDAIEKKKREFYMAASMPLKQVLIWWSLLSPSSHSHHDGRRQGLGDWRNVCSSNRPSVRLADA
jgi:hypothetical protein